MTDEQKKFIDESSYETLLSRWRYAPVGSEWFQGEVGEYYSKIMFAKKAAERDGGVSASKNVGWEK